MTAVFLFIIKVCRMLRDKSVRVHEIGIEVFSPFTPMLGERAAPDQVTAVLYFDLLFAI